MPEIKIGIQLASLRLPFKKALQTAARLGACAVEIDARREIQVGQLSQSGIRQIRKMLEDFNLRVSALTFQTRRGYGVSEDLERRLEATCQAMTVAYALGAPVVVNQIGQVPSESGDLQWDLLVDSLTSLGKHGERAGALGFHCLDVLFLAAESSRIVSRCGFFGVLFRKALWQRGHRVRAHHVV